MSRQLLNRLRQAAGPLMVLLGLAFASPVLATDLNPKLVGMYVPNTNWIDWSVESITVSGTRAYVGAEYYSDHAGNGHQRSLLILDLTNPRSPSLLGSLKPFEAWKTVVRGNYAYVATTSSDGLVVIDVSNPAAPRRIGGLPTSGGAYDVFLSGDYAYVADGQAGLVVVNISNPASPRRVSGLPDSGEAHQIVVSGNYAYLATRDNPSALRIMDISNPAAPTLIASHPVAGEAWSVGLVGNIVYVGGGAELAIFDVSDPANATRIGNYDAADWGGSLPGDRAYVTAGGVALALLDLSNPTSPRMLGGYPVSGAVWGQKASVSGQYAYVGMPGGLGVLDLDQPANLPRVGSLDTPGIARGVAVAGTRAYVLDDQAGLQVLDIADPTKPAWLGNYATSQPARFVAASGNYAYVMETWDNGGGSFGSSLEIVDVSNPAAPQWVGSYETTGDASSFAVAGNHAYLGLSEGPSGRVEVIDLGAPANPQQVAVYDITGFPYDLAVSGHQLFVANGGLLVLDVSNPASPQPVGSYTNSNTIYNGIYRVAVSGTRAYVAKWPGFQILDLSDPIHPSPLGGSTNVSGDWGRLAVSGNYAYGLAVSDNYFYGKGGGFGVQVADISDPVNPRLVGGNSAVLANDLVIARNYVFVAGGPEGLQVFDLALTTPPTPPVLKTTRSGATLSISWPASATSAVLETTSQLPPAANWSPAAEAPVIVGDQKVVTIGIGAGSRFFRLKLQ